MEHTLIFIKEAARICRVSIPTFDAWTKRKPPIIQPWLVVSPGRRVFNKKDVQALARSLPKKRGRGIHFHLEK